MCTYNNVLCCCFWILNREKFSIDMMTDETQMFAFTFRRSKTENLSRDPWIWKRDALKSNLPLCHTQLFQFHLIVISEFYEILRTPFTPYAWHNYNNLSSRARGTHRSPSIFASLYVRLYTVYVNRKLCLLNQIYSLSESKQ